MGSLTLKQIFSARPQPYSNIPSVVPLEKGLVDFVSLVFA